MRAKDVNAAAELTSVEARAVAFVIEGEHVQTLQVRFTQHHIATADSRLLEDSCVCIRHASHRLIEH